MFSSLKLSSLRSRKHNNNNVNSVTNLSNVVGGTKSTSTPATPVLASKPPRTPVASNRRISKWGGGKTQLCPSIARRRSNSVTCQHDETSTGEHVTAVSGVTQEQLRHQELVHLLQNDEEKAVMDLDYPHPHYNAEPSLCVCTKTTQVTLTREDGSLGFTLTGGFHHDASLTRPLTVTQVRPGGPTDREGSIKAGDRLVAVDGVSLIAASLLDAQRLLQQSQHQPLCTLAVEYDVSLLESVRHATGPLLVEIERPAGRDLGVTLADAEGKGSWISRGSQEGEISTCVVIESIRPAGIAERCGALHVGDQVLAVDETRVEGTTMSACDVTRLLTSCQVDHVTLEILPLSQINCGWRISDDCARSRGFLGPAFPASPSPAPLGFNTLNGRRRRHNAGNNRTQNNALFHHHDAVSLGSSVSGVSHTETLSVTLQADQRGFGLSVASSSASCIVVASIDPGGPADRCGCLQVGDRVTSANDRSASRDTLTSSDVETLLSRHDVDLTLDVEFDVADSVVPSSGVFSVKLAKRGNGLGITITASKSRGCPLLISDIARGSVAHRTGTLEPGDRLLAIDSRPIEMCSIQDTQRILQDCTDIVTLRIQKDDSFSEVSDGKCVVYTVDMRRYGGPLGITLAGSEERFQPIRISGLTAGGLAEQTGALHVGDRLLAIDGESLRSKPLSAAKSLLRHCGDHVTLKVARSRPTSPRSPPPPGHFTPGIPSIDSAVESWDSHSVNMSPVSQSEHSAEVYKAESATVKRRQKVALSDMEARQHWMTIGRDSMDSGQSGVFSEEDRPTWDKTTNGDLDNQPNSPISDTSDCSIPPYPPSDDPLPPPHPSPLPLPPYLRNHTLPSRRRQGGDQHTLSMREAPHYEDVFFGDDGQGQGEVGREALRCGSYVNLAVNATPGNQQIELYQVTLFKDAVYEDFGFSVSDGLYERGVYVNRVRKGGPADMSVTLQPFDRILQVNDTRTYDFDCCLTVPLIASAGERLELTIARNVNLCSTFLEREDYDQGLVLSWVDEERNISEHNTHCQALMPATKAL